MRDHRMTRGGGDELLLARELPHHRPAGLERGQRAQILADHFLLAAEAAADALGEHMDIAVVQSEQIAKLLLGDERRLRAGPHMQAPVVAAPGEGAVRLQMHVLRAGGRVRHLVDGVGFLEALLDTAELAVNIDIDVVAEGHALVVQDRRAGLHGGFRVEHRWQELILHLEQAARFLRDALGLGHHGGDPLTDEADDIVEHVSVVGVDQVILMGRGRVEFARHVLPGEDRHHAGDGKGLVALDRLDARMGMGRAQHFQMQRILGGYVERVMRLAGDDRLGERVTQAPAAGFAGNIVLDIDDAVQRVVDRVIAGAAAQIALQHARQVLARLLIEGCGGHDHAGGAEAALKGLCIEERLLHGVELAVTGKALDGRDGAPFGPKGRHQAAMERHAVQPHGAGAAVALVAAFLDAEPAVLAQERSEALARRGLRRKLLAVDREIHFAASSARICSA